MLKKIFKPLSLKKASFLLMAASFFSYLMGLVRDLILTFYFGASDLADVYYTAFLIPDFIFNLTTAGVISGLLIPVFSQKLNENKQEASQFASSFLITSQLIVISISIIAYLIMPQLTELLFSNATLKQQTQIITLTKIMLLSPIIFGISNTLGSYLLSFKHYLSYALSAGLYNIGIIIGIIGFNQSHGIYSAGIGVLIGLCLHLAIRLVDFKSSHFKLTFHLNFSQTFSLYKQSLPKTLSLIFIQSSAFIYNIIGYSLVAGSISAYNYARNIQSFTVSLFGIAIATAVFPYLIDAISQKNQRLISEQFEKTTLQILALTIPSAIGLTVLSTETINFLFQRGAFTLEASNLTALILLFFTVSIPLESINHLFTRTFYAFKNLWTPVLLSLLFFVINLIISFSFAKQYGAVIFALSFSIGSFAQTIFLYLKLKKYIQINTSYLLKHITIILVNGAVMGLIINLIKTNIPYLLNVIIGVLIFTILTLFSFPLRSVFHINSNPSQDNE